MVGVSCERRGGPSSRALVARVADAAAPSRAALNAALPPWRQATRSLKPDRPTAAEPDSSPASRWRCRSRSAVPAAGWWSLTRPRRQREARACSRRWSRKPRGRAGRQSRAGARRDQGRERRSQDRCTAGGSCQHPTPGLLEPGARQDSAEIRCLSRRRSPRNCCRCCRSASTKTRSGSRTSWPTSIVQDDES